MSMKSKAGRNAPREKSASRKSNSYHHGSLRSALIRAARDILESQGFEALTLRAAARRAGVSQAAPYNHFADKATLLAAIAAQGFAEFALAMSSGMDAMADPVQRLNATGIAYVSFATSNPGLFKLMFGASVFQVSNNADLDAARRSAYDVLRTAVDSVQEIPIQGSQEPLESLRRWALVHGLATMINEGTITPQLYGAKSARELAAAILGSSESAEHVGHAATRSTHAPAGKKALAKRKATKSAKQPPH
jgi:AcrR family transcriptional regulator